MNRILHLGVVAALGLSLSGVLSACSETGESREFVPGRTNHDTSEIDVSAIHSDGAVLNRILFMPFGEAVARLGPLKYTAKSHFVFSLGGDEKEQSDAYSVTQDGAGNFHVVLDTPRHQVERYLVGETVYVRTDRGKLRSSPRREIEAEQWPEVAFSALRETLALFRDRLVLSEPTPVSLDGRTVQKVSISLGEKPSPTPEKPTTAPLLPVSPPARWRELAEPLDLTGAIWVDDTGVVIRSELKGKMEIRDREVRPTELEVSLEAGISDIGAVEAIEAPESIPEYRRLKPPGDQLSFFREHIPLPEEDEEEDEGQAVPQ